ncbi:flagellar motor protein MotP [Pallidibacillus pasinlerensis]|uniref:Flagellar motor protein MotP n=1 Tax=Pallidibacillus pasinlerensis TaxID=2703818 RepID=A0ABX0A394_9BACI|nr:flagellar motor protein MotP [Pallidibacillus pasinlerensis]NCU16989.1 flagellar motor protein MotP [Pallidibacillus pasinlerensis]
MNRLDILTPIGIIVGIAVFVFGVISESGLNGFFQFFDISSIVIVFGGVLAALFVSFPVKEMKKMFVVMKQAFSQEDYNLRELIELFVRLSEKARREGLLSLEAEAEELDDKFIKKGILLAIDGIEPDIVIEIMNADIAAMEERHRKGRNILEKAGEYAPAWGMIGTLIGLVLMLNDLNDPGSLGPSMAIALLTTLYGVLLANLFFNPMAAKLEEKTEKEVFIKQIIIEGIIGIQSGQNPKLLSEKLTAFLSDEDEKEENQADEKGA